MSQCADCHGNKGEGVKREYKDPLIGDMALPALARRIQRTMPDDDPGALSIEQATQIAEYVYDAFYSPAAQFRNNPPQLDLQRMTVPQFRTAVADLAGRFRGGYQTLPMSERGLKARYSGFMLERLGPQLPEKGEKKEKERERSRFERIEKTISISFGDQSPDPTIMIPSEFNVRWEGSVYAEETGTYEFIIKSENGTRLWLNDPNKLLIDAWVSAAGQMREEKKSVYLIGGRHYPLVLEFFKFKDRTASVELFWKPPHGPIELIPERNLAPRQVRPTMVVSTSFPADDRSVGYERGTGLSKAWHQATTDAAIAVAGHVEDNLQELAGTKTDDADRIPKLKEFCRRFMETAFRRPTTDGQAAFIEAQFAAAKSPELAVKRVVIFALKSPHFLYPELREHEQPDDHDVASRLALYLWDSLPDEKLLKAAAEGKLRNREEVLAQTRRMIADDRARAKLNGFFHHWLELERGESVSKDEKLFPGFDERIAADLRRSLGLFIEQVVWSEKSDYRELLLADYLVLNDRLARMYGKSEPAGGGFEKVGFDRKERAGVVTHPYLMTTLAHAKYTSPIHRGVFLTRNVLGLTLKAPSMAITFEDHKFDPTLTMREKITNLTKDTACIGCHSVINPLGFALEHYDAIGRWRTIDNNKPVDTATELETDDAEKVKFTGARDVAEFAARSERGHRAFIRQLFNHTVKQTPAAFGSATVEDLRRSFAANEYNIQKLLAEIAVRAALSGVTTPEPPKLTQN
jgi:hypothetical protein